MSVPGIVEPLIRLFQRFTQVSRTLGWDDRFLYMEQSIWIGGDCVGVIQGQVTL